MLLHECSYTNASVADKVHAKMTVFNSLYKGVSVCCNAKFKFDIK